MPVDQKNANLGSKWVKTQILLSSPELSRYVPDTSLFSYANLASMLNKHQMVYVKPDKGSAGRGIIRVSRGKISRYWMRSGTKQLRFNSFDEMFIALNAHKLSGIYIIQAGIKLLRLRNRLTDIRIVIQRNEQNKWEFTGIIGRLAHPRKIVTNYHAGGKALPMKALLSPFIKQRADRIEFTARLKELSFKAAHEFNKTNPRFKELGVDIGLDASLHPWILEVNTKPNSIIFKQLKDKTMFRRMLELKRFHGLINPNP